MIVAVPALIPETFPEELTDAMEGELLLHEPPGISLLKLIKLPTHTVVGPVIVPADGDGFTVIPADVLAVPQPVVTVYVMVALPAATPVITPVVEFTVAAAVLLLLQLPLVLPLLVNVVDKPAQTAAAPVIVPAFGSAVTVTDCVADEFPHTFETA